eukprot:Rhum_TRINITY_DN13992_c0_g1::Rhum_TRINITY_DN13992_c0_g1_i3::g.66623::m.66623
MFLKCHRTLHAGVSDASLTWRMFFLFVGPLLLLFVLCVAEAATYFDCASDRRLTEDTVVYSRFLHDLVSAVTAERRATLSHLRIQNETLLRLMRSHTDHALQHARSVARSVNDGGTAATAGYRVFVDEQALAAARSLADTSNLPEAEIVHEYNRVALQASQAAFIHVFGAPEKGGALLSVVSAALSNAHAMAATTSRWQQSRFQRQGFAASDPSHRPAYASATRNVARLDAGRHLFGAMYDGSVHAHGESDAAVFSGLLAGGRRVEAAVSGATGLKSAAVTPNTAIEDLTRVVQEAQLDAQRSAAEDSTENAAVRYGLAAACASAAALLLFVLSVLGALRWLNKEFEAASALEWRAMRDTMHRIGEYTQHFAHFNLSVPQLPSGTAQNALEFSLLRCLSSLKLVCPAIPPEVFPERFVVRRQPNYNDTKRLMCDMEVIMNQIPSFPVRTDVGEPQALMMKRCALGVAGREATVMTVSLLWAHSLSEEGNKASRYLIPYVALVEQLTLQHGGLVHKLVADRMMCTWNLNPGGWQGGTYTVRACAAAMAIAPGTAELFAHERIHVSVALTHGLLLAGNVGFEATDDNSLRRSTQPSCTLSSTEQKALMSAGSDVQQWEEPRVHREGSRPIQ